ncbi:MAG: phospho-2-dehydro-3-deoxyheptonate aldolase [Alphaproteobacteria bacterium]|nr:MAG: phospho-2-dehydro-3-deoxyheptonate aldolase [Alphaproteobacteria bacterium]
MTWKPNSWRNYPVVQMPTYPDESKVNSVEAKLSFKPPLVFAGEVQALKKSLALAEKGNAFILQGGDCAESFSQFSANGIRDTFKVLLQMAVILTYGSSIPIIKIGRIAGQFAKPRSSDVEIIDGIELPSYRGDMINDMEFNKTARQPDPQRLIDGYEQSAATLNLIRAFAQGGMANLEKVHEWTLGFLNDTPETDKYREIANSISESLNFMKACGLTSSSVPQLRETDFFTSHEALLLNYEEALTREDTITAEKGWYATSAHLLWVGDRTRQFDHGHIEYLSGIQNPVGIKCGPSLEKDDLIRLLDKVNPNNESGKVVLICRMGSEKVNEHLPKLIKNIKANGKNVTWCCDPMHGNTIKASNGYKTRRVAEILNEVNNFFLVHKSEGTLPGGVHFEMTGSNVTECLGGANEVKESDLGSRYHTHCDPRLNGSQSLELAFLVSDLIKSFRNGKGS